jgi:hypothetical protein
MLWCTPAQVLREINIKCICINNISIENADDEAYVIKDNKNSIWLEVYKFKARLVVGKIDFVPYETFSSILLLFHGEHVVVEKLDDVRCSDNRPSPYMLKFFVSIVDAKLLEGVDVEVFKAEDVLQA